MKKLFTILAAALFSAGMMADVVYSFTLDANTHTAKNTEYAVDGGSVLFGAEKFETKEGVYMYKLDGDPKEDNSKYALLKLDEAIAEGDVITIDGLIASNASEGQAFLLSDSRAATTKYVTLQPTGPKNVQQQVEWTVPAGNAIIGKKEIYISRESKSLYLIGVKIENAAAPSTDPVLSVNPEEVTLALTAAKPADVATVTFTGKNLTPGEYSLTVPNLAGFEVEPLFITVGADGKLSQQVTISFSSDVDVEAGSTKVALSIAPEQVEASVKVNYSASFEKNYLSQSVNIEQWVLDNGKDNQAFPAVLEAANIEFENINELDSLNDEKPERNEPYLGLKLKKQGARVACWIKEGDKIAVKFGALKDAVTIGVNGEYNELEATDLGTSIERTTEQDAYIEIITKSDKTIVLKQIMINEDIAEVTLPGEETAIDNTAVDTKATKRILNGQVVIEKNGKFYDLLGTELK